MPHRYRLITSVRQAFSEGRKDYGHDSNDKDVCISQVSNHVPVVSPGAGKERRPDSESDQS